MEQHLKHQIKTLIDSAHRYWLLLEGTRQALEQQPGNAVLQMRASVLEKDIDHTLESIEELWRQLCEIQGNQNASRLPPKYRII